MTSSFYSQPLPELVIIDPHGDLILNVHTISDRNRYKTFIGSDGQAREGVIFGRFQVSQTVLFENSAKFRQIWAKETKGVVDLEVSSAVKLFYCFASIEACLRALHDSLLEQSYPKSVEGVWEVLFFCHEHEIFGASLQDWFKTTLARHIKANAFKEDDMRRWLKPCYTFNEQYKFAEFTKYLAYHTAGHVEELNPTDYDEIHLDGNLIGGINGARGSIHKQMMREFMGRCRSIRQQACVCKAEALVAYENALESAGLWALWDVGHKSIYEILYSLHFEDFECKIPKDACSGCQKLLDVKELKKCRKKIMDHFHGLCLDCIFKSKTGSYHEDYWKHAFMNDFGKNCSFKHGQSTWYFSFMGRPTDMAKYKKMRAEAMKDIKTAKPSLQDWEALRDSLQIRGIIKWSSN